MKNIVITQITGYPLVIGVAVMAWAGALVLQHGFGLEPCSLCILQRWALTATLVLACLAFASGKRGRSGWASILVAVQATGGLVVALKHLWLQLHPTVGSDACGLGGLALLDNLPLTKAVPALFAGSGDCAQLPLVAGAPLAAWSAIAFVLLLVLLAHGYRCRRRASFSL